MGYRVMAVMETGEETCMKITLTEEQANAWIDNNYSQYPELLFFVESQEFFPFGWNIA